MAPESEARTHTVHRVIARLNVGGPTMHVVNLVRAMNDGPWRSRLVAGSVPASEGDMSYYARDRGVRVTLVRGLSRDLGFARDVRALLELVRLFRRERPDVVHTHTAKAGTLGRVAAMLAGVPVRVHTFHGHVLGGGYFPPWKTRLFLEIERWLARGTHRLVVLTERQAREMSEELRVAGPDRFAVVPLGLELDRYAGVDADAVRPGVRSALDVPPDAAVVGIVGRLVPIKNHDLFLRAIAALGSCRDGRPVVAVVVGSGEREPELRRLAAKLDIEGRVRWLGWRRDLPDLYAALDVLALTSDDEGTPVAILEALASGTRVVARHVGGVGEVLDAAGAGTLVPREADEAAWASAIRDALAGPRPDASIRVEVTRRYAVERLVDDLTRLYEDELARSGRPPKGGGR